MKKILIYIIFILSFFVIQFSVSYAQDPNSPGSGTAGSAPTELENPLGKDITPQKLIGRVINAVLGIVGSIALAMFIYGGFIWMTAAGNQEKVSKGKEVLVWATVGLIVIFASYALVNFVFQDVLGV